MKNYNLYSNRAELLFYDGSLLVIYFTGDTGKCFFRYKINTISEVKHPGIVLGIDSNGKRWFMHNHYENKRPVIVMESDFAKGQPIFLSTDCIAGNYLKVVDSALAQIVNGQPYSWLNYNCQSFVNISFKNQNRSEDVEKWGIRILASLFVIASIKALNSK
jgi:hypothetical protein